MRLCDFSCLCVRTDLARGSDRGKGLLIILKKKGIKKKPDN